MNAGAVVGVVVVVLSLVLLGVAVKQLTRILSVPKLVTTDEEETTEAEPEEEDERTRAVRLAMGVVDWMLWNQDVPVTAVFEVEDAEVAYVEYDSAKALYAWEAGENAFIATTERLAGQWKPLEFVGWGELSNDQAWKIKRLVVDGLAKYGQVEVREPARLEDLPQGRAFLGLGLQRGFKERLEQIAPTMSLLDSLPGRTIIDDFNTEDAK